MPRPVLLVFALAVFFACDATKADSGTDALLQVAGAQFYRQALPGDQGGPHVSSLSLNPDVAAGLADRHVVGDTGATATAIALSLTGDVGYWILPTGVPNETAPGLPTFTAALAFSPTLPAGPRDLRVSAIDAVGHFGAAEVRSLTVASVTPEGQLVVSVRWSNDADLDLHVVVPDGTEIFHRNISSYERPPPGAPLEAPGTPHDGGVLDEDSEAECVPDGLRAEHVVFTGAPPRGHYVARVDTASLCGLPDAYWTVEVLLRGARIAGAQGISTPDGERAAHGRGAGVLAVGFDVP